MQDRILKLGQTQMVGVLATFCLAEREGAYLDP